MTEAFMTRPVPLGDAREHLILIRRMARATGADPQAAAADDRLGQEDWADAVTRCRGCDWVGGCRRWLDARDREDGGHGVATPPEGCANRTLMAALRLPEA